MDLTTLIGIIGAVSCVVICGLIEKVNFGMFLAPGAFTLIVGGTFCATMIGFSIRELKLLPTYLRLAFFKSHEKPILEEIQKIVTFAEKARREGLLALEDDTREMEPGFSRSMLEMIVDGTEPDVVKHIMKTEMEAMAQRHKKGAEFFTAAGGYAPTMGIVGTVLGVVGVLAKRGTGGIEELGHGVALAFVATFLGIGSANLLILPIGVKLQFKSHEELFRMNLIAEGFTALQAGENPTVVRTRLMSFLETKLRPKEQE